MSFIILVRRARALEIACIIVSMCSGICHGAVITFSEQPAGENAMSPSTYGADQGLGDTTALFKNFTAWDGDFDHTPSPNNDNKLIYGDEGLIPSIVFSAAVQVPSLWVSSGINGGNKDGTVTGKLNGLTQFTFINNGTLDTWHQITSGSGKSINTLTFTNFDDNEVDDLTVQNTPESSALAIIGCGLAGLLMRRRSKLHPAPENLHAKAQLKLNAP